MKVTLLALTYRQGSSGKYGSNGSVAKIMDSTTALLGSETLLAA